MMTCNLGMTERGIRFTIGLVFLAAGFLADLPGWGTGTVYVLGAITLVTGAAGFCPAWKLLGINTCATKPPGST